MQRLALTLLGLGLFLVTLGQDYRLTNNVPVLDFLGQPLPQAWAGGNGMPHYSDVDLNGDGFKDLVVFDRLSYYFTTYLNDGIPGVVSYTYAPEYMAIFEDCDCREWALLVDYNCDGREDLFCGSAAGQQFAVYENVLVGTDSVSFVERHRPLTHPFGASFLELYVTLTDVPAITDVDYDGDIDIISTQPSSNRWALYRNRAMEDYGRCDTLAMDYETFCWGHFSESFFDNTLTLADTFVCPRGDRSPNPGGGVTRHEGGMVLVLDTNADSLKDVLVTDVSYNTAILAINGGNIDSALMVDAEYHYPQADSSIDVTVFPALYHVDINNDNIRDLLVSPNSRTGSENVDNTVVYLNRGQDEDVDFRFMGRTFLPSHQIDLGGETAPLFWDYNADGLMDLLVGSNFIFRKTPDTTDGYYGLHLYQNVGDSDAPIFQLVDSNYLDFRNLTINGAPPSRAVPAAGDLDGDGDEDLLFGLTSGRIIHYENTAGPGNVAQFVAANPFELVDQTGQPIDPTSFSAPELYDFDGDGDVDLFVGNKQGEISYYENTATAGPAIFTLQTEKFGKVKPRLDPVRRNENYSKPRFIDYDQDGAPELVVGEVSGRVEIYDQPENGLTDSLLKVGNLLAQDFSARAAVTAAVLDSTGYLTWVVGNERGGLHLVNALMVDTTSQEPVDPDSCLAVDEIEVQIDALARTICVGDTVALSASSTGDSTTFSWLPRVSVSPSTGAQTLAYPQFSTTYVLQGQQGGCSASDTFTVQVSPRPSANPRADVTLLCTDQVATLQANARNADSIIWQVEGVGTLRGEVAELSFTQPGELGSNLRLISAAGCEAEFQGPSFRVEPRAVAAFSVSPDPGQIIPARPGEVTVQNQSQNAIEYFWDFGDGTSSVFANLTHAYDDTGRYVITLIATDEAGCTDTASIAIEIGEASLYIPNVFTPNEDGYNDHFTVRYNGSENADLLIVDRYGRALYQADDLSGEGWDGQDGQDRPVPEGVYFYVLRLGGDLYKGHLTLLR